MGTLCDTHHNLPKYNSTLPSIARAIEQYLECGRCLNNIHIWRGCMGIVHGFNNSRNCCTWAYEIGM